MKAAVRIVMTVVVFWLVSSQVRFLCDAFVTPVDRFLETTPAYQAVRMVVSWTLGYVVAKLAWKHSGSRMKRNDPRRRILFLASFLGCCMGLLGMSPVQANWSQQGCLGSVGAGMLRLGWEVHQITPSTPAGLVPGPQTYWRTQVRTPTLSILPLRFGLWGSIGAEPLYYQTGFMISFPYLILSSAVGGVFLWLTRPHQWGFCPQCGYDLRGTVSGVCPECGHEVPA